MNKNILSLSIIILLCFAVKAPGYIREKSQNKEYRHSTVTGHVLGFTKTELIVSSKFGYSANAIFRFILNDNTKFIGIPQKGSIVQVIYIRHKKARHKLNVIALTVEVIGISSNPNQKRQYYQ